MYSEDAALLGCCVVLTGRFFRTGSALPAAEVLRTVLPPHGVERTGFGRADADCERESLSPVRRLLSAEKTDPFRFLRNSTRSSGVSVSLQLKRTWMTPIGRETDARG